MLQKKQLSFNISWSHFKWTALFSQLKYSGWYFASALAAVIAYNVQIVLLGKYLTDTQMATFLLIFRFFEVIRIGMTNFTQVLFPTISMRQAAGDWKGIYANFKMVFLRVFALSLLIFSFIFLKGYDVFVWWSDYYNSESLSTFQVYTLYVFFLVIDHVAVIYLLALKFNKVPAIISILQSVLSLFATIIFIQQIGLPGAVWASLLLFGLTSLIFNPLYLMHHLRKQQAIL